MKGFDVSIRPLTMRKFHYKVPSNSKCVSVLPFVQLSAHLSLLKSEISFAPEVTLWPNFQVQAKYSQVDRPTPRKGPFLPNLSPPNVLGQGAMSNLLGNGRTIRRILMVFGLGPEGLQEATKILSFQILS